MTGRRNPTHPRADNGSTPADCTIAPCAADPCADPAIEREDEELIACILELCSTDPQVVERASHDLVTRSRQPKVIQLQTYDGSRWATTGTATSRGSARGNEVWINRGQDCNLVKETIYHEVHHTTQPRSMSSRDREIDAFMQTEQWLIDRGLPGNEHLRMTAADGSTVADRAAIEAYVDRAYGYSSTTQRIVARENGGTTVALEDGTRRPAQAGDRFQYVPPQALCERLIPPERLSCP